MFLFLQCWLWCILTQFKHFCLHDNRFWYTALILAHFPFRGPISHCIYSTPRLHDKFLSDSRAVKVVRGTPNMFTAILKSRTLIYYINISGTWYHVFFLNMAALNRIKIIGAKILSCKRTFLGFFYDLSPNISYNNKFLIILFLIIFPLSKHVLGGDYIFSWKIKRI